MRPPQLEVQPPARDAKVDLGEGELPRVQIDRPPKLAPPCRGVLRRLRMRRVYPLRPHRLHVIEALSLIARFISTKSLNIYLWMVSWRITPLTPIFS